ncbi:DUF4870 domain-containing protein [Demequina iriomotensis]|uniref:DUF4870 domain-containing protein n=1 Tax=Demequina iriomotensis TaxID=1536641 RepID=UPI000782CA01|nr:DUF4870 domain-containing protein [Demequina iriomotensis]
MTENPTPPAPQSGEPGDTGLATVAHATVFTGFLIPLIIWLVGRERSTFTDTEGKEALNFGILVTLGYVAAAVVGVLPFLGFIGYLLDFAVFVVALIFGIQGAMAASKGQSYRYPFSLRLVA